MPDFGLQPADALIERVTREATTENTTLIAQAVRTELESAAAAGERWAAAAMERYALEGIRRDVRAAMKRDRSIVRIGHSGTLVSVPSRVGVRRLAVNGSRAKAQQQSLWWELPWEAFKEFVQSLRRQSGLLTSRADAYADILRLEKKYPDTKTAGEACERAGIDPRAFEVA
jgi:hypothetical protein